MQTQIRVNGEFMNKDLIFQHALWSKILQIIIFNKLQFIANTDLHEQ